MVLAYSSEDDGGLARVASRLALGLPRHGVRTAVAIQRPGPASECLGERGVTVHVVPELIETLDRNLAGRRSIGSVQRNLMGLGKAVAALRRTAREHQASLIYSHGSWPNHLAAEATRSARDQTIAAVWHLHVAPSRSNLLAARLMAKRGRVFSIVGVSEAVLAPYASLGASMEVIPNGVDLCACADAAREPVTRSRLNLPPDAFVVGYAGRMTAAKGIKPMTSAVSRVLKERPNAHFVLLGGNPASENRDWLAEIRQTFAAAGVSERTHLTGYVQDPLGWIAGFDLALAPSIYPDPCPLAVIEALSVGTPVLASNVGGIPELIDDGETGLLLPPNNVDALASAIVSLIDDPGRRARMAARARRVSASRFDEALMVARSAAALRAAAARIEE